MPVKSFIKRLCKSFKHLLAPCQKEYIITNIIQRWNTDPHYVTKDVSSLDSAESVDIYLKKCGYGTRTGLPFPLDGVGVFHPHQELPHIPLSISAPKTLALDRCTKAVSDSEKDEPEDKPNGDDERIVLRRHDDKEPTQTGPKPIHQRPRYDPDFVDFDFFPNIMF
ncbi:unnamed protein product [Toxocara canis]|uniref:Rhythmically expressed gene 5 protein n=1 Tax=Toxocara canis TaxID=6265 RepID=A0A183UHP3_TOXCA|nr:unnamed protein product [Toxocara canis]